MFWEVGLKQAAIKHLSLKQRLKNYKIFEKEKKNYNKNQRTFAAFFLNIRLWQRDLTEGAEWGGHVGSRINQGWFSNTGNSENGKERKHLVYKNQHTHLNMFTCGLLFFFFLYVCFYCVFVFVWFCLFFVFSLQRHGNWWRSLIATIWTSWGLWWRQGPRCILDWTKPNQRKNTVRDHGLKSAAELHNVAGENPLSKASGGNCK